MSVVEQSTETHGQPPVHRLKAGSVGLVGVIFMALATAAPITAMTGNLPVIIGGGTRTVTADHTILAVPLPILQQHVDLTPPAPFTDASSAYTRDLADRHLAQIDTVWPGTRAAWNGRATLSAWHLNPYSYGAYSYWPVGYLTGYAGYEGTAQGNLHFAGEHCSYDYQGYMNGGAVEGARAAAEVLTAIGA